MMAFKRVEEAFANEAGKAGFQTEGEMQDYMKEIRERSEGILVCGQTVTDKVAVK